MMKPMPKPRRTGLLGDYDVPTTTADYDYCEPDIGRVVICYDEGSTLALTIDHAERLLADLDAAVMQAKRGTDQLLSLVDPSISDSEAHARLAAMNTPSPHLTCGMCDHAPHREPCYCGCSGKRRGVYVDDGSHAMPTGVSL